MESEPAIVPPCGVYTPLIRVNVLSAKTGNVKIASNRRIFKNNELVYGKG